MSGHNRFRGVLAGALFGVVGLAGAQTGSDSGPFPQSPALTVLGKERVTSAWENTIKANDHQAPPPAPNDADGGSEDMPKRLTDAGVLADEHAWPAGCHAFRELLEGRWDSLKTPAQVNDWNDWRVVYVVTCQVDAVKNRDQWLPAITDVLGRLEPWTTQHLWAVVTPHQVAQSLLERVSPQALTCMAAHVPEAIRQGLDRHEGLRYVAKACMVSDTVFGSAVSCLACGAHPRMMVGRTTRALVSR